MATRVKPTLEDVQRLQGALGNFPQLSLEPRHYFAQGQYVRELWMPSGSIVVSKIHKHQHISVMVYGDTTVYTERDGKVRHRGYHTMVTEPGTKRALYMHEDTLWLTFHSSESRDLSDLEDELITPDDAATIEKFASEFRQSLLED